MTIVIRSKKQIVALHEGVVYLFSVEALEGKCAIPKVENTRKNEARTVVGIYFDDDFKRHEVFAGVELAKKVMCKHTHTSTDEATSCPGRWIHETVVISKKRLDELEVRNTELSRLEAAGVDNWEGY